MTEASIDVEALLQPISGQSPAGEDLRYSSLYDEIKAARQGDPVNQIPPDWPKVEKLTTQGLLKNSKDLQLAVWLLEALTRNHGFAGAADGLLYLAGLIETFWDGLYPEIDVEDDEPLAFRTSVLLWVADKFSDVLKSPSLTADGYTLLHYEVTQKTGEEKQVLMEDGWPSFEQFDESMMALPYEHWNQLTRDLEACRDALAQLEAVTDERFVEKVETSSGAERVERLISFYQVKELLETCLWLSKRAERKKAEDLEASESPVESPSPVPAAATEEPASEAAPEPPGRRETTPASRPRDAGVAVQARNPEEAFRMVSRLAAFLREDNPYRPIPYLLTRAVAWGQLFGIKALAGGSQSAPTSETRSRLQELRVQEDWWGLLQESENALEDEANWAWLDLHRYGLEALQNLGYERAALAVQTVLAGLLQVHPGLPELELADGTLAADPETRAWIEDLVTLQTSPAEPEQEDIYELPIAPYPEPLRDAGPDLGADTSVWEEALERLRGKDFAGGLELLQQRAAAASSGRERFLRKLDLADFCLLAGQRNLSFPLLDELVRTIDEFHLEQWEDTDLIVRTWSAFVRCCRKERNEERKRRAEEIFDRLCRLDVTKALSIEKD